jgi:hypothetical protein
MGPGRGLSNFRHKFSPVLNLKNLKFIRDDIVAKMSLLHNFSIDGILLILSN